MESPPYKTEPTLTYNPLTPRASLPPSPAQKQFDRERSTAIRTVLRTLPRNLLGLAILTGLGRKAPARVQAVQTPAWAPRLTPEKLAQSNAAIARMRAEHAKEKASVSPGPASNDCAILDTGTGEVVREALTRGEDNKNFAKMYQLRRQGLGGGVTLDPKDGQ